MHIGLSGGIGSGKSTVAGFWREAGAEVVDTDAISRSLTAAGGAAMPAVVAEFGASMMGTDGALDRARMRELVFTDATARHRLEAILHPLIGAQTRAQAEASTASIIVFDVPLLVESGLRWRSRVERVLIVDCPEAVQAERVMQRSGWTREAVEAVIRQQATRAQRRACADAVIHNDAGTPLAALREQVLALATRWQA
ncbi:dephospho-CoA kinase [Pelomonas sp. KK5]|uniref:dephospho-CoA kinase n=1 Tax=Pelomonas sp. KK5 TaxID=1855730 RepID=UPI00097C67EB|nr:dephospho-CoA kinase [Pelomonas sp. KK5]